MDDPKEYQRLNEQLQAEKIRLLSSLDKYKEEISLKEMYSKSVSRFQTIFDQSFLGKKIISSDMQIRQINPAMVALLGYSKEEIVGKTIVEFTHPSDREKWDILRGSLWDEKVPSFQLEVCLINRNGASVWCRITSILFEDNEETLSYTIVEDISERKKLEEEAMRLRESQEAIIYTVAHDLKNPLFLIEGLSKLIRKNIEIPQDDSNILSLFNMLNETTDKAQSIIKDLLLVGELEQRKMDKTMNWLKEMVEEILFGWDMHASEKGIKIDFLCTEDVCAPVNRSKIRRVLDNLISNAIKFTKGGGRIEVKLKQDTRNVIIEVNDNGIGITESQQANIFDKFTKFARLGTSGESTTGLGLFISKRIVELHEGNIRIKSEPQKGSTFIIELPLAM